MQGSRSAGRRGRTVLVASIAIASVVGSLLVTEAPANAAGPTIASIAPNTFAQGVFAKPATLMGTGFVAGTPGTKVTSHSGITFTSTFVNSTQLNLLVDISPSEAPGSYNVIVTNPDTSTFTCAGCLTVVAGSVPIIDSLSPNALPQGASGQTVMLTGSNFMLGATVTSRAGINATVTFVSGTQLSLSVNVAVAEAPGLYDIFVTNPDNSRGSCINCLTIVAAATTGNLAPPYAGMAALPSGNGYWLTSAGGGVTGHGSAVNYGSMAGTHLNAPITHIVSTTDGLGYWLVAADGGTFTFGDAQFFGSMGGKRLNAPVVDIAPTPSGNGYWLVASDGGIFSFGDAVFQGSTGGMRLNQPVVGMAADSTTGGYWLVATDGGIFSFGAPFFGSTGNIRLNQPVNGMAATGDGGGYWLVASDGGIFTFGDAQFFGSAGGVQLNAPIVGMAADLSTGGYWLTGSDGSVFTFGGARFYGSR